MPELPEVEHVVRALRPFIVGRRIWASEIRLPKLSAPTSPSLFKRKVKGATITGVSRRGKYILIELDRNGALPDGRASNTSDRRKNQKPAREQGLVLAV